MISEIITHAKLNLSLKVSRPNSAGYHAIDSLFQAITLKDQLIIEPINEKKFIVSCNVSALNSENTNLSKIYAAYKDQLNCGYKIQLNKSIPLGAGLGGGSGNAAGFLHYINQQQGWNKTAEQLATLSKPFGSDIAFFFYGGRAKVTGIGDQIQALNPEKTTWFVLILPEIHCSSAKVYKEFDRLETNNTHLGNMLAPAAFSLFPDLKAIYDKLESSCASPAQLSGSGSTLFYSCSTETEAIKIQSTINSHHPKLKTVIVQSQTHAIEQKGINLANCS